MKWVSSKNDAAIDRVSSENDVDANLPASKAVLSWVSPENDHKNIKSHVPIIV